MGFIFILSVIPDNFTKSIPYVMSDKIAHFIFYGITAVLLLIWLRVRMPGRRAVVLAVVLSSVYGFFIEVVQYFIPWRSFSMRDFAADVAGAVILSAIFIMISRRPTVR